MIHFPANNGSRRSGISGRRLSLQKKVHMAQTSPIQQPEELRRQARKDWLALCGIQAAFWSVVTMQTSFLVSFLTRNGYSDTLTATIVFLTSMVNLAAQPMWGYVADAKWDLKRVILCCLGMSIPALVLMPAAVISVAFTIVLNLMYGFFNQPLQGLTDAITNITATHNSFVTYGFTRGCTLR